MKTSDRARFRNDTSLGINALQRGVRHVQVDIDEVNRQNTCAKEMLDGMASPESTTDDGIYSHDDAIVSNDADSAGKRARTSVGCVRVFVFVCDDVCVYVDRTKRGPWRPAFKHALHPNKSSDEVKATLDASEASTIGFPSSEVLLGCIESLYVCMCATCVPFNATVTAPSLRGARTNRHEQTHTHVSCAFVCMYV